MMWFNPPVKDQVMSKLTDNPLATRAEMAQEIGCSQEAIRIALLALGIKTFRRELPHCNLEGCNNKVRTHASIYCSRNCLTADSKMVLTCNHCQSEFQILKSQGKARLRKSENVYCSRQCRTLYYIAKGEFGWQSHRKVEV